MVYKLSTLQKALLKAVSSGGSKAVTKAIVATLLSASTFLCSPITLANRSLSMESDAFTVQVYNSRNQTEHLKLNYTQAVRLEQVLADTIANITLLPTTEENSNQPVYWTGAGLYRGFPHPNKASIIRQLEKASELVDPTERDIFRQLATQLNQLKIGERVFTPLDYDLVRINKASNPIISAQQFPGPMTLVLPSRPDSVWVLGAVQHNSEQPWVARTSANQYLEQVGTTSYSDNSTATIIQPDGTVEMHPIAYWNKDHMDIAPGAIVYLGFNNLPTGYQSLNDEIINLLRNKAL
ncbi:capsule biosynthesis GfcC family protein [Photobacterium rosenbergii]|nr:capsule biosynthesis GfcC family protein [Photobacterium rosenbergii]